MRGGWVDEHAGRVRVETPATLDPGPLGWEAPRRAGARRAASQACRGCGDVCVVARGESHVCRRVAPRLRNPGIVRHRRRRTWGDEIRWRQPVALSNPYGAGDRGPRRRGSAQREGRVVAGFCRGTWRRARASFWEPPRISRESRWLADRACASRGSRGCSNRAAVKKRRGGAPRRPTRHAGSHPHRRRAQLLPRRSARLLRCRHPEELPYVPVQQPVRGDRCVPAGGMHRTRLPGRANRAGSALPQEPQP